MKKGAFTLVELIVVITILAILATIGFVSFSGYLDGTRDTNRISQLKAMSDALELYRTKKDLPIPDDKVDLSSDGTVIAYQGYIGANVLETIEYTEKGLDPKDKGYFSYYLTKNKKYFQLMSFLEEPNTDVVTFNSNIFNASQAVDYENRYPKVTGKKLGILTDTSNTPIQEVVTDGLEMSGSTVEYIAHFQDSDILQLTANNLRYVLITNGDEIYKAPSDCADGFIGVKGNAQFNQEGFCVAQYEMSHVGLNTPNSAVGGTDWNTVAYDSNTAIESKTGKYPIADITQGEAIIACQSLGTGYHLITNNEWMSVARNIELQKENWSSGIVGTGDLYNGVSNNSTLGCSGTTGGNTEARSFATKTGPGSDGTCNSRRSHSLSNGLKVWDLSGNIYEYVNKANTLNGNGFDTGQTIVAGSSNGILRDDDGIYTLSDMDKYGSIFQLGIESGMGNLYYANGVASNVLLRGGYVNNGTNAGIFNLQLHSPDGNQLRYQGFRCAK